ncbi:hypothetical protein E2320_002956, partial [Naja naja]
HSSINNIDIKNRTAVLEFILVGLSTTTEMQTLLFWDSSYNIEIKNKSAILETICRIRSTEGKKKAFSTCSSHFIIVSIFYSSVIYTYIRPSSAYSPEQDKIVALLYSVVTPLANPVIYSLRNKDFKEGLKTLIGRIQLLSRLQY